MLNDLLVAARRLRHRPRFCFAVVSMLALVIALGTLVVAWARGMILAPLNFDDPGRLVRVFGTERNTDRSRLRLSQATIMAIRDDAGAFVVSGSARNMGLAITELDRPTNPLMREVSRGWFETLGVRTLLGRTFDDADHFQCKRVVVLKHSFWRSYYGGDPQVIGKSIELAEDPYVIIGVLGPEFRNPIFPLLPALWLPLSEAGPHPEAPENFVFIGRMGRDTNLATASHALSRLATNLENRYPQSHAGRSLEAIPLEESVVEAFRPALAPLLGASLLILLIAFSNVGNLWMTRATDLRQEAAVRFALGAQRFRLLRMALAESLLLCTLSAAIGLGVAAVALEPLKRLAPLSQTVPLLDQVRLDALSIGTGLAIAATGAILLALLALGALSDRQEGLGGRSHRQLQSTRGFAQGCLVVSEIALSMILIFAAGLTIQALADLRRLDLGFEPISAIGGRTGARGPKFEDAEGIARFHQRILETLVGLPGVSAAGSCEILPMFAKGFGTATRLGTGRSDGPRETWPAASTLRATPGFFAAFGTGLVRGRGFQRTDVAGGQQVAILTRSLARVLWGDSDPLGQSVIADQGGQRKSLTVVGIVDDQRGLPEDPIPQPLLFVPHAQDPTTYMSFVLRVDGPFPSIAAIEDVIWTVSAEAPVYSVATLSQLLRDLEWRPRMLTQMLAVVGLLALILAMTGVASVLAYQVAESRAEIAVRMAIGANRAQVLLAVLTRITHLVTLGLILGIFAAVAGGRFLASCLHGVPSFDWRIFLASGALLTVTAMISGLIPARRATLIDPARALRR